jgi:hypothetical protein
MWEAAVVPDYNEYLAMKDGEGNKSNRGRGAF